MRKRNFIILLLAALPLLAAITIGARTYTGTQDFSGATLVGVVNQIEDEGSTLTKRTNVNFVGSAITCADSGGKTVCTVTGGSASAVKIYEEFCGESSAWTGTGEISFNFTWYYNHAANSGMIATNGEPCVAEFVTATTNGSLSSITLGGTTVRPFGNISLLPATWAGEFVIGLPSAGVTDSMYYIYFGENCCDQTSGSNEGVYFKWDSAASDTNWEIVNQVDTAESTNVSTGVAATNSKWYKFRIGVITSPAAGVSMKMTAAHDSAVEAKAGSYTTDQTICANAGCTINAGIATESGAYSFGVRNRSAASGTARVYVAAFALEMAPW